MICEARELHLPHFRKWFAAHWAAAMFFCPDCDTFLSHPFSDQPRPFAVTGNLLDFND